MPDISMCSGVNCPIKKECYRFTAIPNVIQSYSSFRYDEEKKECEFKIENDER